MQLTLKKVVNEFVNILTHLSQMCLHILSDPEYVKGMDTQNKLTNQQTNIIAD